jgi:hypothetical protein
VATAIWQHWQRGKSDGIASDIQIDCSGEGDSKGNIIQKPSEK